MEGSVCVYVRVCVRFLPRLSSCQYKSCIGVGTLPRLTFLYVQLRGSGVKEGGAEC